MKTDVIIYDKVSKAEQLFAWQLGTVDLLQDVLGRSHADRSDISVTLSGLGSCSPRPALRLMQWTRYLRVELN